MALKVGSSLDISGFRAAYKREGKFNLAIQVPFLSQLAEHYASIGMEDPIVNWRRILQVGVKRSAVCNRCIPRNRMWIEMIFPD